jgi:hypothetical protein
LKLHVQPKNIKLGNIWNISLPAVETCGGLSAACAGPDGKCYVLKIYKRRPNVLKAHQNTYVGILEALDNGEELELPTKVKDGDVFRLHVAGDFFDASYVYAWMRLMINNPNIQFFAYTCSWRMAEMVAPLHELAELPNMTLLLSVDRDTGYPNADDWNGFRTAFMMVTDDDADLVEPDTHVVFRDNRYAILKQVNGNLVCPTENGITKTTCEKCKWCFKDNPNKSGLGKVQRRGNEDEVSVDGNLSMVS